MQKRLEKEFTEITNNPPTGVVVEQNANDRLNWVATIGGPIDTPYFGGNFRLNIKFPDNYPFKAPEFMFLTSIFHPNITEKGEVCQDMIGAKDWQPTRTTKQVLELIINMLAQPNPDQSLNNKAMDLYKQDKSKFDEAAKLETQKHANQ